VLLALCLGSGFVAYPVLDPSSSAREIIQRARSLAGADAPIALVAWKEQNLLQAVGPTVEFGFRRDADEQLQAASDWLEGDASKRRLLLSQPREGGTCFGGGAGDVVKVGTANRRDWYLVSRNALTARCYKAAFTDRSPD
jgi:hypothetical protein